MQTPFHGPIAVLLISGALALTLTGTAQAQVAGSTAASVTLTEAHEIALGWSAKRSLLGKPVYNDTGDKIGTVQDLIITPDHHLSYVIVGAGGFIGIGRHDVAFPVTRLHEIEGRIVMPGATRDVVRTTPRFDYASDDTRRASFSDRANQDIARARDRAAELEQQAVGAESVAKARLDQQVIELRHDIQAAEGKLAEMNRANASRWKSFEHDVNVALARLHKVLPALAG
jgi:sporulation protein YlmC with PRC-barrel domain